MYARETIAAIATAPGVGGIAIVRVSGDEARRIGDVVFRGFPSDPESHRLYVGRFIGTDGAPIDRGIAALMRAPRSYTGEDVLELHCHGGPLVARTILAATLAAGARSARPGEFTLRAFLNGKLDLAQAEAVADVIGAKTESAARLAGAQLDGELSRAIEDHRQALVGVAAALEAAIDFADEDDVDFDAAAIVRTLRSELDDLRRLAETFRAGRLLREGARVVFAGAPNVGKSSLVNRLLGTERIIVTPSPGTTRDTIEETADVGGLPVVLVDTAGLREAEDLAERFGIERSRSAIAAADLVVCVVDRSVEWNQSQRCYLDALQQKAIVALNKADLPARISAAEIRERFHGRVVETTATTEGGIDALAEAIAAELGSGAGEGTILITRERHWAALERTAASLELALAALAASHPPEVIAVDVTAALGELGEIVGLSTSEEILDRVFREFCIGK